MSAYGRTDTVPVKRGRGRPPKVSAAVLNRNRTATATAATFPPPAAPQLAVSPAEPGPRAAKSATRFDTETVVDDGPISSSNGVRTSGRGASKEVTILPPRFQRADVRIIGTAPYVQHKFSKKALNMMEERQRSGEQARKNRRREARDFEADYRSAMHISEEGWCGIPAPSFRNALISACRTAGFTMTRAKLSVFVEADGIDADDGTPLIRIKGEPERHEAYARNESGVVDIRWRPMWRQWSAVLHLRWDADQFSINDVLNLLARAGMQVGVGEGRPDSPKSNGMGWGLWDIDSSSETA